MGRTSTKAMDKRQPEKRPTMKEFFHRISPAELLRRAKKKKAKSLQKEGA